LAGRSEMTAWLSICTIDRRKPSDAQATLRGFSHDMFDEVQKAIQLATKADMP